MNHGQAVEYLCDLNAVATFEKIDGSPQVTVAAMVVTYGGGSERRSCVGNDLAAAVEGLQREVENAKKRKAWKESDKFKTVP